MPTKVGFALAPTPASQARQLALGLEPRHSGGSQKAESAQKFIAWATGKDYLKLVAKRKAGRSSSRYPHLPL